MADIPEHSGTEPSATLIAALRRLLAPLVRLSIHHGITYPTLCALLKTVYVQTADADFQLDEKPQTDSRVSLLTGIHRKDVRRLRAQAGGASVPAGVSLGGQIAARWAGDPRYRDDTGAARPLARLARDGGELSFEALVASVNRDIRPRAVLDEWMRLGVVSVDARDRVCLTTGAFVPSDGFDEKAWYLGRNVHDHLAAAAHNLSGARPALFERCVYYDRLSAQSVTDLATLARVEGMRALQTVNARALELQETDAATASAKERISFGAYFFTPVAQRAGVDRAGKPDRG